MESTDSPETESPAEREFIERVRRDRARARTLVRRSLFAGAVLVAALASLVASRRATSQLAGEVKPPARAVVSPGPATTTDVAAATGAPREAPTLPRADDQALEQRIGRLERRVGVLEERPASPPRTVARTPPPRSAVDVATRPRAASATPRVTARRPAPAPQSVGIGERFRRGWETVIRPIRRAPDELREGFAKVKAAGRRLSTPPEPRRPARPADPPQSS